jgi:hypothetical protein
MVGKEVSFDLEVDGKPVKFAMRRLTFGQRNHCLRQATKADAVAQTAPVDYYLYQELRLVECIIAPVEYKNLMKIRDLPIEVAEKLLETMEKLHEISNPSSAPSVPA